eukprot:11615286-Alexandrium_andersonii.AAC.1
MVSTTWTRSTFTSAGAGTPRKQIRRRTRAGRGGGGGSGPVARACCPTKLVPGWPRATSRVCARSLHQQIRRREQP